MLKQILYMKKTSPQLKTWKAQKEKAQQERQTYSKGSKSPTHKDSRKVKRQKSHGKKGHTTK